MRNAKITRKTKETDITAEFCLDGNGIAEISTGIGFFDHMLTAFAVHGNFNLKLSCKGDLDVDGHHTVEDTGIVLGNAAYEALGDKKGIERFACAYVPMDDALARCVIDISGRPYLSFNADGLGGNIGEYDSALTEEFFRAFCVNARINMHIDVIRGRNAHHICEAVFKAFARAFSSASKITGSNIPSTKGSL